MRQPEINGGLIDEGSRRLLGMPGDTETTSAAGSRSEHTPAKLPVAGDLDYNEKLQDKINQLEAHFEALQSRCHLALEELTGLKRKLNTPENESRKRAKTNVDTRVLTSTDVRDNLKKEEEVAEIAEQVTTQAAEPEGQLREHGPFTGSLSSKTKSGLLDVAQALQLTTTGTRKEVLERIRAHLIAHPEKMVDPTFAGLFISRRRPTNDENPSRPPSAAPSDPAPSSGTYHEFPIPLPTPSFPPPYMGLAPFPVGPNLNAYGQFYNYYGPHYTYY